MSQVITRNGQRTGLKDGVWSRRTVREWLVRSVSYVVPIGFVAGVLLFLVRLQFDAETAVASLAGWLP